MALIGVVGEPGSGKTLWAVVILICDTIANTDRNIFCNLPIDRKGLAKVLSYRYPFFRGEWESRLTVSGEKWPDPRVSEEIDRHFWHHVGPGDLIILDEAADLWPIDEPKKIPTDLRSYINHHRHETHDVYFFCQALDDLCLVVRKKVKCIIATEDCLGLAVFPQVPILNWVVWPVTWFRARQFNIRQKDKRRVLETAEADSWNIYPRKIYFGAYRSFEAARNLTSAKGSDQKQIDKYEKQKRKLVQRRAWNNLLFACVAFGSVIFGAWWFVKGYLDSVAWAEKHQNDGAKKSVVVATRPAQLIEGGPISEGVFLGPPAPVAAVEGQVPGVPVPSRVSVFAGRRVKYWREGTNSRPGGAGIPGGGDGVGVGVGGERHGGGDSGGTFRGVRRVGGGRPSASLPASGGHASGD